MFGWFWKPETRPDLDFSQVDSATKTRALYQTGHLHKMLLIPAEFGGDDIPPNVVYVPELALKMKQGVDRNVIAPLVEQKRVSRYRANPTYEGRSFIPSSIEIVAFDPGSFSTRIAIWGDAVDTADPS
jgi:hypothetical protein